MEEILNMSNKELDYYRVLIEIQEKRLSQIKGAELLNLSTRQIRNLLKELKKNAPKSLQSKKRGKASNRRYKDKFKHKVIAIIKENYEDFGPTMVKEKLQENHQISISTETARLWMVEANIWQHKARKRNRHPLRQRKECFGELIQVDGSHHDWFEARRNSCALIVFIDDATSKLTSLYFAEGETLDAYFNALENHIKKYGRPKGLYSDRFAVFQSQKGKKYLTQFKRALNTLDIAHFTANSPQAKGRVERVNKTLQDRLVKEMRLKNISTIEEANRFCEEYMVIHNNKFSKEPISKFDAHRPLETDLSRILSVYEERTLSNNLSICFHNKFYQICEDSINLPKKAKIEIRKHKDGNLRFFFEDQELNFICSNQITQKIEPKMQEWKEHKKNTPVQSHPWKEPLYNQRIKSEEMRFVI